MNEQNLDWISVGRLPNVCADNGTNHDRAEISALFGSVRSRSMAVASPLTAEDQCIQSMPDVSPTKWHLAHTTWFFETFILAPHVDGYEAFDTNYSYLFNSYYETVGPRHDRPKRGLLSRPPLDDVHAYRQHVDDNMARLMEDAGDEGWTRIEPLLELGLNHEQQHQELMLTDIKNVFACNPLRPAYQPFKAHGLSDPGPLEWLAFDEGLHEIGHQGAGFAFDNEGPRHKVWLNGFRIGSRPVTNGEYMAFIEDGGYQRLAHWLSDGWAAVGANGWQAPLYWEQVDGQWQTMTLAGMRAVDGAEPVCHISFYEANAFANWAGKRLPTEAEWETAVTECGEEGNFADSRHYHPVPGTATPGRPSQVFGDVWEWTASAYGAYPGYRAAETPIGEYNGKFMSGQMVLKGGSAVTPAGHVRSTYRNFFYPPDRWQFSGLRLAEDA